MTETIEYAIEKQISETMQMIQAFWEKHQKRYGLSQDCLICAMKELRYIRRVCNEIAEMEINGEK